MNFFCLFSLINIRMALKYDWKGKVTCCCWNKFKLRESFLQRKEMFSNFFLNVTRKILFKLENKQFVIFAIKKFLWLKFLVLY